MANAGIATDIAEAIAKADDHDEGKCPFCCEKQPKQHYTTFPGIRNNSKILGALLEHPEELTTKQPGARPKDGKGKNQEEVVIAEAERKEKVIWVDDTVDVTGKTITFGRYTCEAHHLISGRQALQGHMFERWISKKPDAPSVRDGEEKEEPPPATIEEDTGYSVNNAANGFWCPSIPVCFKKGGGSELWGDLSPEIKREAAFRVMKNKKIQFHCGPHDIEGVEGHQRYDEYLKDQLTHMDEYMIGLTIKCPICCKKDPEKEDEKYAPSIRANILLDALSAHMKKKIKGNPGLWTIFLSRLAKEFIKENSSDPQP